MKDLFPELYGQGAPEIQIVEESRQIASWELCVSIGMQSRDDRDAAVWMLGAITTIVQNSYSTDKDAAGTVLKKFSGDVGVEVTILMKYKRQFMSVFDLCGIHIKDLTVDTIPPRPYPELSWSHLVSVTNLSTEDKKKYLEAALDENLTAKQLRERVAIDCPSAKDIMTSGSSSLTEIEMVEKAFIRIDHTEKVVWMRKEFGGYELRLL